MADEKGKLSHEQHQKLLFFMLVQQHEQIALMGLGEVEDQDGQNKETDLSAAKYAMDTLEMLEAYTKGNVSAEVKEYLTHTLAQLRLKYADKKKINPGS